MHAGAYISSLIFSPAGTHEHLAVGLSTGHIKIFSQDLNLLQRCSILGQLGTIVVCYSCGNVSLSCYICYIKYLLIAAHIGSKRFQKPMLIRAGKLVVGSEEGNYLSEKDGYSFIIPRSVLDSDVTCNHTWHCSL